MDTRTLPRHHDGHDGDTPTARDFIRIVGARENNLRDVDVAIAKRRLTVFTGVSGSGKSSLVFDVIAAESQRQLNETFSTFVRHRMPHYGQPHIERIENLSVAIVIDQKRLGGNARSTVGTATDLHALLRLMYSRFGTPHVGEASVFSFNNVEGMCTACEGIGSVATVDVEALLDRTKSLNEGPIRFEPFAKGSARWKRYVLSGYFDNDKKLGGYSDAEWELLLHAPPHKPPHPRPGWWASSLYEGLVPRFKRSYIDKADRATVAHRDAYARIVTRGPCPACRGARLNPRVLSCRIAGANIAEWSALPIDDLMPVVGKVREPEAAQLVASLCDALRRMSGIGLGYLSLDRETSTLSGGESQRVKMLRHLGSSLSDLTYILDEPSVGLHPRDVHQVVALLRQLRDAGNTVLVVEHDPLVIRAADEVIDMGPGAGHAGGRVVFQGSVEALQQARTPTGAGLAKRLQLKPLARQPTGWLPVRKANVHNLQNVDVDIPLGVLTAVVGVAGSGKSSLINGVFARRYPEVLCIDQGALGGSRRSNTATYLGVADHIRQQFAAASGLAPSMFSANSEGACPACHGLGIIELDMAFMESVTSVCSVCGGRRFKDEVLRHQIRRKNIDDVLRMTVADAERFFGEPAIVQPLQRANEVGLGYMSLGQALSSLSGGERQRLKLATALTQPSRILVLDEPTSGLHMADVDRLIDLMSRMVDAGSTLIVIEHNIEVMAQADWLIEIGPGAGLAGGRLVFQGTPAQIVASSDSLTGQCIGEALRA